MANYELMAQQVVRCRETIFRARHCSKLSNATATWPDHYRETATDVHFI
jgi:hypothetical protein